MSAPINQSIFGIQSEEPFVITATLWRGAMIDRFAQIEFFIDRSLAHCVAASLVSSHDAEAVLPRLRCKALLNALERPRILERAHAASRTLGKVFDRWDERNALCHGRMKLAGGQVTFHWPAPGGSDRRATLGFSALDMLDRLHSLDQLKTALGSQLGAIDKYCASLPR